MIYTITKYAEIGVEYQIDAESLDDAEQILESADYSWFRTHDDLDEAIVRTEVFFIAPLKTHTQRVLTGNEYQVLRKV